MNPSKKTTTTKWATGALAAAAAGTGAQAALVQISLEGYSVTAGGGNSINLDLTGDGVADIQFVGSGGFFVSNSSVFTDSGNGPYRNAQFAGEIYIASNSGRQFFASARSHIRPARIFVLSHSPISERPPIESSSSSSEPDFDKVAYVNGQEVEFGAGNSVTGGFTFQFIDANLNPFGSLGFLEVTAGGLESTRGVTLNRLVWNNEDAEDETVGDFVLSGSAAIQSLGSVQNGVFAPIPEPSGLALLALGGAGVLARRRRKAA